MRVLIVFFETPPSNGASVQRFLSAYAAFIEAGFDVDVLTASPDAYSDENKAGGSEFPPLSPNGSLMRPMGYDVQRHLSWNGKYIGALMTPDRWGLTWIPNALYLGLKKVKANKPDLIWSSSPIPSVHLVATALSYRSGALWVADYRDPTAWTHKNVPFYQRLSQRFSDWSVSKYSCLTTFATQHCLDFYKSRYNSASIQDGIVVSNGFDPDVFKNASMNHLAQSDIFNNKFFSIYYSGVLYPDGRCPVAIFRQLAQWNAAHPDRQAEIVFQGAGDGVDYDSIIAELGLKNHVKFIPKVTLWQAISNMLSADALLLIQDSMFNLQIPGKLYEYLFTNRPLLLKTPIDSASSQLALGEFSDHEVYRFDERDEESLSHFIMNANLCPERPSLALKYSRYLQSSFLVKKCIELIKNIDLNSIKKR